MGADERRGPQRYADTQTRGKRDIYNRTGTCMMVNDRGNFPTIRIWGGVWYDLGADVRAARHHRSRQCARRRVCLNISARWLTLLARLCSNSVRSPCPSQPQLILLCVPRPRSNSDSLVLTPPLPSARAPVRLQSSCPTCRNGRRSSAVVLRLPCQHLLQPATCHPRAPALHTECTWVYM